MSSEDADSIFLRRVYVTFERKRVLIDDEIFQTIVLKYILNVYFRFEFYVTICH